MRKKIIALALAFVFILSFMSISAAQYGFVLLEPLYEEYMPGDVIRVKALTGASLVTFTVASTSGDVIYMVIKSNKDLKEDGINLLIELENSKWKADGSYVMEVSAGGEVIFTHYFNVVEELSGPQEINVTGVSLNKESLSLYVGDSSILVANIEPKDATNKNVSWQSSNESVATVNSSGLVKGIAEGTAVITVTTADGGFEASAQVTVRQKPSGGGNTGGNNDGGNNSGPQIPFNNNQPTNQNNDENKTEEPEKKIVDIDIDEIPLKFTDVDNVPWAIEAIKVLFYKGVINGMDEKTFAPNAQVTRAQFMVMLVKALEIKASGEAPKFSDVQSGQWYTEAVSIAASRGIIKGYTDNTFGINDPILRQDMAVVIVRAAEVAGKKIPKKYNKVVFVDDLSIADYAKDAVYAMQQAGIISGVGQNIFAPTSTATRAQAAKIIYELMKL